MGLDMYLAARKSYDPTDSIAIRACELASTTFPGLEIRGKGDPREVERTLYVGGWTHGPDEERAAYFDILEATGLTAMAEAGSPWLTLGAVLGRLEVQVCCLYWRKANAVHSWFVQNCQDGTDECQESPVHPEQLAHLRSCCLGAIAKYESGDLSAAREAMTPASGFFFGSTDVDEWWLEDLRSTVAGIDRIITAAIAAKGVDLSYRASW